MTRTQVLSILQNHYPERLGKAFLINIPFLLNAFFKLIMPLVDPVTREKVKFNPDVVKDGLVSPDMLMSEGGWGGDLHFEWDHTKYWKAINWMTDERRKTQMEKWRQLGGKVGLDEWAIKGGATPNLESASETSKKTSVEIRETPAEIGSSADE